MSIVQHALSEYIVKENFGDLAKSIVNLLNKKKSYTFTQLSDDLNINNKSLAQILSILINQNLIEYKLNSRSLVEYTFLSNHSINRIRYPKYINTAKVLYGYTGELIIEEILLNGSLEMSSVLLKVYSRLSQTEPNIELSRVKDVFNKLVQSHYLKRMHTIDNNDSTTTTPKNGNTDNGVHKAAAKRPKVPNFIKNDTFAYVVPEVKISDNHKKRTIEDGDVLATKIRRPDEDFGDCNIYWKVNFTRFDQYLRDQVIVDSFESKIDKNASNIVKAILRCADLNSDEIRTATKPITAIDIQKIMRNEHQMDGIIVDKYLTIIVQDSFSCVEKVGDFGGGAYVVDFRKAIMNLCKAHIESFIREKYGSKSLRIFKVIMDKIQLEQKQIEDFAMIPSKDCKSLLYTMLNDNILSLTELSKTSDHAPSRTFYLFTIDLYQLLKKVLHYCYKGYINLMIRHEQELSENKRLLEKQQKLDAIIQTLKSQGAEQMEIDDVQSLMNPHESSQLKHINEICDNFDVTYVKPVKNNK